MLWRRLGRVCRCGHMVLVVVVLTSLHSQEWQCLREANSEDGGVTKE